MLKKHREHRVWVFLVPLRHDEPIETDTTEIIYTRNTATLWSYQTSEHWDAINIASAYLLISHTWDWKSQSGTRWKITMENFWSSQCYWSFDAVLPVLIRFYNWLQLLQLPFESFLWTCIMYSKQCLIWLYNFCVIMSRLFRFRMTNCPQSQSHSDLL